MDHGERESAVALVNVSTVDAYHPRPPSVLQRRIAISTACLTLLLAVLQALAGNWWPAGVWGLASVLHVLTAVLVTHRPPATFVSGDGVLLRTGWARTRVGWNEVDEVLVQGRWAESSRLRLRDGRLVALPGVVPDQAQRLADALAAARDAR